MSARQKAAGVDNTARRTWDREEFREKAEKREAEDAEEEESIHAIKKRKRLERDPLHQGLIVARSNLTSRDYELNLTERLNKTQVIGLNTPLNQQAGYYCKTCDCVLRDSQSYLDHINGKYHNRALGMSMRVEKSTVEQVSTGAAQGAQLHRNCLCCTEPEQPVSSSSRVVAWGLLAMHRPVMCAFCCCAAQSIL
jgi:U4/U6.U5 tri-snRNP component SNU23